RAGIGCGHDLAVCRHDATAISAEIADLGSWNTVVAAALATPPTRVALADQLSGEHAPHRGNHEGYACGFSGPHCWVCHEPWPCRTERGVASGLTVQAVDVIREAVERAGHFSFLDEARSPDTHVQIRRSDWEEIGRLLDLTVTEPKVPS